MKLVTFESQFVVHKLEPYQASYFQFQRELKAHVEEVHKVNFQKRLKCDKCPKKFAKADKLKRHIKIKHDDSARKYKCPLCPLETVYAYNIKTHMRTHSKDPKAPKTTKVSNVKFKS